MDWRILALVGVLSAAGVGTVLNAVYQRGASAQRAICDQRITTAQNDALRAAAKATEAQRARANALAVATRNLQDEIDELLAQPRTACPLGPDLRERLLRVRPAD